jgi:hypothetical protein
MALPFPAAAQRLCDRPFGPMSERCNRGHLLFRNQKHRSAFNRRQESRHVFEYLKKRHLALFAFAFGSAGCLMAWTINLSIERLLATDWDQKGSAAPRATRSISAAGAHIMSRKPARDIADIGDHERPGERH